MARRSRLNYSLDKPPLGDVVRMVLMTVGSLMVVGTAVGLVVSSVVLSGQIQGVTYTNSSWEVNTFSGIGLNRFIAVNAAGIVLKRTFVIERFPTYTKLTLGVGGAFITQNQSAPFRVNFTDIIEPPYVFPFISGTAGGGFNQIVMASQFDTPAPGATCLIGVYGTTGARNLEFEIGSGSTQQCIFTSPALFQWAVDGSGNLL